MKVTTREGWVKLEGEPEQIDRAQRVFEQLEQARQKGVDIQRHEFNYAFNSVTEARPDNLSDRGRRQDRHLRRASRRSWRAPSGSAITSRRSRKTTSSSASAPPGPGKTYLAVAMAVAALKKEQVSRIILTRPAVEAGEALGFLPGRSAGKNHALSAAALRCAARHAGSGRDRALRWRAQTIEVAPLAYMRGRTLEQRFRHSGRSAEHDDGADVHAPHPHRAELEMRRDRRRAPRSICPANKRSGLVEALQALKDRARHCASFILHERDVVRHELVRAIINAYQQHRSPANAGELGPQISAMFDFLQTQPARETRPRLAQDAPPPRNERAAPQSRVRALDEVADLRRLHRRSGVSHLQRPAAGADEEFRHRAALFRHRAGAALDQSAEDFPAQLAAAPGLRGHLSSSSPIDEVAARALQQRARSLFCGRRRSG